MPRARRRLALHAVSRTWTGTIVRAMEQAQGGDLLLVERADAASLGTVVRQLLASFPGLQVVTDRMLDLSGPPLKDATLLWATPSAGPCLARLCQEPPSPRVLVWMRGDAAPILHRQVPALKSTLKASFSAQPSVPDEVCLGLEAAQGAAGIVWRDGPLEDLFRLLLPGVGIQWVNARQEYAQILRLLGQAGDRVVVFTEVDGPFLLRRVRWALAQCPTRYLPFLMDPALHSPGWWTVNGRSLELPEAALALASKGADRPALLAALCSLDPGLVDLAGRLLVCGVSGDSLVQALSSHPDPASALVPLCVTHGCVSLEGVARREEGSVVLRVMDRQPQVRAARRRSSERTLRGIRRSHWVDPDLLAFWASTAQVPVPRDTLLYSPASTPGWLVEVGLRRGPPDLASWLALAEAAVKAGDPSVAAVWVDGASEMPPQDPLQQAQVAYTRGRAAARSGHLVEAETLHRRALDLRTSVLGPRHPEVALDWLVLGRCLHQQADGNGGMGLESEAMECFQRAYDIQREQLGPDHPTVAITLHALGEVLFGLKRLKMSYTAFRQALAIKQARLGQDHPSTAATLHAIGKTLTHMGRLQEGLDIFLQDLEITERCLGREHLCAATTLHEMGKNLIEQGRFEEALGYLCRERTILELALGEEHPSMAPTLDAIGRARSAMRRHLEALDAFRPALHIKQASLGPHHPDLADTLFLMGETLARMGDYPQAEARMRLAVDIRRRSLGPQHLATAAALHSLGETLGIMGRMEEALNALEQALEIKVRQLGPEHVQTVATRFQRGRVLREMGRPEGLPEMEASVARLERVLGADHAVVEGARYILEKG